MRYQEMKMIIPEKIYQQLHDAAEDAAPIEACGLLAGKDGRVEKFYPMTNADAAEDHFSMTPEEQFAAVKDMRKNGLQMLAIWHSHPASPPRMSEEDLRLAFTPGVAHVILSLAVSEDKAVCGFEIDSGDSRKIEITIAEE
jgi:[CysO sulfur-carrier protein]-S-L-cysteine hydrolase